MISIILFGLGLLAGFLAGLYFTKLLPNKDKEITTESLVDILKERGYWVTLNRSNKNG